MRDAEISTNAQLAKIRLNPRSLRPSPPSNQQGNFKTERDDALAEWRELIAA